MTVVIDCNILVMCVSSRSRYYYIFQSLVEGKFQLLVTNDIILEYEEILERKYGSTATILFLELLETLPNVVYIHPSYNWYLITNDPDDNKYCDCAIAGQAHYIVTEDKHFTSVNQIPFPKLDVISITHFWDILLSN